MTRPEPSAEDGVLLTPEQLVGRVLDGRYRLESVLATGGMGVVYVGRDVRTHRTVAVKLLKPHAGMDQGAVKRFLREVDLTARLRHPHVVDVLDLGTVADGRAPYLVMELLSGRSLAAELNERGQLPVAEALELVLPVMSALARVHAQGIVHRDVKPGNIFLHRDAYGRVTGKLLDFGIAKDEAGSGETSSSILMGTPAYMAPEQLKNVGVGPTTDVWAMGAVLYACLSGHPPFQGATSAETMAKIAVEAAPPLVVPGVHRGLLAAIDRALARDPADRYRDMVAFAESLIESAQAAGIEVELPPPGSSTLEVALGDATEPQAREGHRADDTARAVTGGVVGRRRGPGLATRVTRVVGAATAMALLIAAVVTWGRPPALTAGAPETPPDAAWRDYVGAAPTLPKLSLGASERARRAAASAPRTEPRRAVGTARAPRRGAALRPLPTPPPAGSGDLPVAVEW